MWGCDCDGERRTPTDVGHTADAGLRRHLDVIEATTGVRPETCPWRAMYSPIVREVLEVSWSVEEGNLAAAIGDDPPGILVDAIGVYRRALVATRNDEARAQREERAAERRAESAARKAANVR